MKQNKKSTILSKNSFIKMMAAAYYSGQAGDDQTL